MVFVHLQVSFYLDGQVDASVLADLFQHVVEESQSGMDVTGPVAIQVQTDIDIGFVGRTPHFGSPLSGEQEFSDTVPVCRGQYAGLFQFFRQ